MPVIAMTREMGSQGKDIAIGLAERLGMHIVHHNLIEHGLSDLLDCDESDVHRFLEGKLKLLERWSRPQQKKLSNYTVSEVLDLASQGNVIIRGWGSAQILRSVAHVICIRVCAPMSQRIETMMDRMEITDWETAKREVYDNDAAHDRVLKSLVQTDWRDPLFYDLVINTENVPIDKGVDFVAQMTALPSFQVTPQSEARLKELKKEAQVRNALAFGKKSKLDLAFVKTHVDPRSAGRIRDLSK